MKSRLDNSCGKENLSPSNVENPLDNSASRNSNKMIISIIICTHGRCEDLKNTLNSLQNVIGPNKTKIELLLVENGSKGEAESLLTSFSHDSIKPRYLYLEKSGKSKALNLALDKSQGDILVFSDDDIRFPKDWLIRLCEPIISGKADAVAGGVFLAPHLIRPWMDHMHRAWLASTADYLSPKAPSELCGANMAFHRRVLDKVPRFETNLGPGVTGGGEESLFSWQIKEAGFRIQGALDVQVEHHLNPNRLLYECWIKVAKLKGYTRAYCMHHWFHETLKFPRIKLFYFRMKLFLRKALSKRHQPMDEGIAPWEISYLCDIGMFEGFLSEFHKPRAYAKKGLSKLDDKFKILRK